MPRSTSRSPSRIQRSSPRSKTRRSGPARRGTASGGAAFGTSNPRALGRAIPPSRTNAAKRIRTKARCPRRPEASGNRDPAFVVSSDWRACRLPARPRARSACLAGPVDRRPVPIPLDDGGFAHNVPIGSNGPAGRPGAGPRAPSPAAADAPAARPRPRALLRQPGDRGRAALARRQVHRVPQALERHAQHLGQEDRASPSTRPRLVTDRDEAADPRLLLEPRQQVRSSSSRTRTATRTSTSTPSIPPAPTAAGQDAPAARNLTDAKGARAVIYAVPKTRPRHRSTSASTTATRPGTTSTRCTISTGERDARAQEHRAHRRLGLRPRRQAAAGGRASRTTATPRSCASIPTASPRSTPAPSSRPAAPRASTRTASASTWRRTRATSDLTRLVLFDPETGKEELVESDPAEARWTSATPIFSEATDELVGDLVRGRAPAPLLPRQGLRGGLQAARSRSCPGKEIDARLDHRRRPALVRHRAQRHRSGRALPLRPRDQEARRCSTRCASASRASTWRAMKADPLPVVGRARDPGLPHAAQGRAREEPAARSCCPHGGPWARDNWGFDNLAQFLANRGYAVLQPNFRGSTGYGKKFLNAGNKQWGDKMQDDITWGVKYLVARGHRRSQARRDHGRLLRRLRDAGRRGLHARPLRAPRCRSSAPRT